MTTWATLRTNVRIMLSDIDKKPYRWSDDELLLYCQRAVQAYSKFFPLMASATPTGTDDAGVYLLDETWDVERVSYLTASDYEEFLEELDRLPGTALHAQARGWWTEGSTLYIFPTHLDDIEVYYYAPHPVPEADDDELSIPEDDLDLLELYIMGRAMDRFIGKTALLDRWKERGTRTDNPVEIPRENWKKEWAEAVAVKLGERRIRWYVKGPDRSFSRDEDWISNV